MFINDPNEDIPWEAMLYMTGHINYGGRVTDDKNVRLIKTILKQYICREAVKDDYNFSASG